MGDVDCESLLEAIQNGDPISIAILVVIGLTVPVSLFCPRFPYWLLPSVG